MTELAGRHEAGGSRSVAGTPVPSISPAIRGRTEAQRREPLACVEPLDSPGSASGLFQLVAKDREHLNHMHSFRLSLLLLVAGSTLRAQDQGDGQLSTAQHEALRRLTDGPAIRFELADGWYQGRSIRFYNFG